MSEPYRLPVAELVGAVRHEDVATVTVVVSQENYLRYPIAPADVRLEESGELVFPFHQLVDRDGLRLVFETYDSDLPLPAVGATFAFCSWWVPDAMDAVLDREAAWELDDFPDTGQHEHCLLSWATIATGSEHPRGYRSSHGWITVDAYRDFIERDVTRMRNSSRSVESPDWRVAARSRAAGAGPEEV